MVNTSFRNSNPKFLSTLLVSIGLLTMTGCTILKPSQWPKNSRQIILTFDDGPSKVISRELLDVLAKHDVKVTFCYIGKNIDDSPDIAQRALEEGHSIAYHSYSHTIGFLLSDEKILREWDQYKTALDGAAGRSVEITRFRPPLGLNTPAVRSANKTMQLHEAYLTFFINDAKTDPESAPELMDKIKKRLLKRGGGAIVLHEMRFKADQDPYNIDKTWLPKAVDELILWGKENGFTFVNYQDKEKSG